MLDDEHQLHWRLPLRRRMRKADDQVQDTRSNVSNWQYVGSNSEQGLYKFRV